jgi:dolichol-phosphate mannosyltransferase
VSGIEHADRATDRKLIVRLAIIIPMYNEMAGAEICVEKVLAVIPTLKMPAELMVVDDGSNDGTAALLDGLRDKKNIFTVIHKPNGGYGHALRVGAEAAARRGFDYLLFMDSDLTNPPEHITRFVPPILEGVDLVKGSRFSDGGDMDAVPWRRRIFSIAGNLLARALFRMGIADCTNGFRAIRTSLFLRMPLHERGFAVILEELYWAKRLGATVTAVPSSLTARTETQRPSLFAYRPRVIWQYLKYALRAAVVPYPRAKVRAVERRSGRVAMN